MGQGWYYVEGRERVGPVEESQIETLFNNGTINDDCYVWKKGFTDWIFLKDSPELAYLLNNNHEETIEMKIPDELPPEILPWEERKEFDWKSLDENKQVISIKIGLDREGEEVEYGPYSINQMKRAMTENRINEKTLIFASGMPEWQFLGEVELYSLVSEADAPKIEEEDRRKNIRRPFIARMLLADDQTVLEGVCRDISVGGLQILLSGFPGKVGDEINLNVHPENNKHCFVATGKIVRLLDGDQGVSIRFVGLNEDARSSISSYVSESE